MVSPVLAGLSDTQAAESSTYAVVVPFEGDACLSEAFLLWAYPHRRLQLTDALALGLTRLSHKWNVEGIIVKVMP